MQAFRTLRSKLSPQGYLPLDLGFDISERGKFESAGNKYRGAVLVYRKKSKGKKSVARFNSWADEQNGFPTDARNSPGNESGVKRRSMNTNP